MADGHPPFHRPPPFRRTVGTKQTTEAEVGGLDAIGPAGRPENCQDNPQVFGGCLMNHGGMDGLSKRWTHKNVRYEDYNMFKTTTSANISWYIKVNCGSSSWTNKKWMLHIPSRGPDDIFTEAPQQVWSPTRPQVQPQQTSAWNVCWTKVENRNFFTYLISLSDYYMY